MNYNDFFTLADNIHESLQEVKDMKKNVKQIDTMLDDISRKIGRVDEVTLLELERRR